MISSQSKVLLEENPEVATSKDNVDENRFRFQPAFHLIDLIKPKTETNSGKTGSKSVNATCDDDDDLEIVGEFTPIKKGKGSTLEIVRVNNVVTPEPEKKLTKKDCSPTMKRKSEILENSTEKKAKMNIPNHEWFTLPDGWKKQIVKRGSSGTPSNKKKYDVYLITPTTNKKLRSNNDILRWVQEHPAMPINTMYVNMSVPLDASGSAQECKAIEELTEKVNQIKNTGQAFI